MRFTRRSVFIPEIDTFVVSDLHLGRPFNSPNHDFPTLHDDSIESKLKTLINGFNPSVIIFNGDTFHHAIPLEESEQTMRRIILSTNAKTVFTIGNHEEIDSLKDSLPQNTTIKHKHTIDNYIFHHGHEEIDDKTGTHVIGHLHPSKGGRPAHIKSKSEELEIIVTPAFNPGIKGTKIENVEDICPVFKNLP
jgi:metallophosphoesterase superfamily enzyme